MNETETASNGSEQPETQPSAEADLQAALDAAIEKAEVHWSQYLRTAAELENTRKRAQRDVEHAHRYALERFAADLGPVRDSLELGLAAARAETDSDALRDGVEITLKQLDQALAGHGIELVDPTGQAFDPERHEAVQTVPTADASPGTVLEVVQKGLVLNGRLVRAARVLVSREPDPA